MATSNRGASRRRSLAFGLRWLLVVIFIAFTGVLYMVLFQRTGSLLMGVVYALACSLPLVAFEKGEIAPALLQRIRRLATPAYILASLGIYFVLSGLGFALAGVALKITGITEASWTEVLLLRLNAFLYTLVFFLFGITTLRIRQLLGRQVFNSLLTGRYRHPIQEERVFLFIDVVGSTAYAGQFGDLRAQAYLGQVFANFAVHVRSHKGEIDDYVGDCAIITWPMNDGVEQARCVACLMDIIDDIAERKDWWRLQFGVVPQLSAALHGGSIVTAEIGVFHHKITYFGDVVNTTARIEGLCKSLMRPYLISGDLLRRLALPDDIEVEPLGAHLVKGRDEPLSVFALKRMGYVPFETPRAALRIGE